jgi:glucose/arabinose dehydrogenase
MIVLFIGMTASAARAEVPPLQVPPGFRIAVWAEVPDARSLALGSQGSVFVGTRRNGRVFALRDSNGDGRADERWILLRGLNMPNGVAFHDGALYVAESGAIWRLDDIVARLARPPAPRLVHRLKPYRHHGWRYIAFGPDGRLYISLGAPCNVCEPGEFGAIWRLWPDGSAFEPYARGVRNSVGLAFHPRTGELWFTDNGRDWLGDDQPSDELDHATRSGQHFGFPYCHGGDVPDPDFGTGHSCADFVPPVRKLGAHVASLGLRFYTGSQFPAAFHGSLLIAEHGSWNRSSPVGYRVVRLKLDGDRVVEERPLVSGWLAADGSVSGRPVDLLVLPDGSLLISDDAGGRIWRLSHPRE